MINNPEISIIICTYNREKFLPGALISLTNQTLDASRFEILIINNNSTDSTELISSNFITSNPKLNIKYFVETQKGLSAARNRGIKESAGKLVAFIDDDAEVTNDYLETAIDFFDSNPNIDAIGGKIIPVYETGEEPKWLSKYLWGLVTKADYGENTRKYPVSKYPPGCSMVFKKEVFTITGMFNTELFLRSDDKYIFRRLEAANKLYLYFPKLVVNHHIDKERVTFESVKKISLIVGGSERVRLQKSGIIKNIYKIIEYIFKLFAAIIISFGFLSKFEFSKAEYIVKNRWYTLLGYFITEF
jgi:glycosyltransferase involved in cell wall biosynthesis